eukprot:Gb_21134 [translate_table: standard]
MATMASILENPFMGRSISNMSFSTKVNSRTKFFHCSPCRASWQELAGVLVFSAIPFTAVKAIANSPLGARLQERMQATKSSAIERAPEIKAATERAREESSIVVDYTPTILGAGAGGVEGVRDVQHKTNM